MNANAWLTGDSDLQNHVFQHGLGNQTSVVSLQVQQNSSAETCTEPWQVCVRGRRGNLLRLCPNIWDLAIVCFSPLLSLAWADDPMSQHSHVIRGPEIAQTASYRAQNTVAVVMRLPTSISICYRSSLTALLGGSSLSDSGSVFNLMLAMTPIL